MTAGLAPGEMVWRPATAVARDCQLVGFMRSLGIERYDDLVRRADDDSAWLRDQVIRDRKLRFFHPYEQVLDLSGGLPWPRWCVGADVVDEGGHPVALGQVGELVMRKSSTGAATRAVSPDPRPSGRTP